MKIFMRSLKPMIEKIILASLVYCPLYALIIIGILYVFMRLVFDYRFDFWLTCRWSYYVLLGIEIGTILIQYLVGMITCFCLSRCWGVSMSQVMGDMLDRKLGSQVNLFEWDRDRYLQWQHGNEFMAEMMKTFSRRNNHA